MAKPGKEQASAAQQRQHREPALERERALRQTKKLKTEKGRADGNSVPRFIAIPEDLAKKVSESDTNLDETRGRKEAKIAQLDGMKHGYDGQEGKDENGDSIVSKRQERQQARREARQKSKTGKKGRAEPTANDEEVDAEAPQAPSTKAEKKADEAERTKQEKEGRRDLKKEAAARTMQRVIKPNRDNKRKLRADEDEEVEAELAQQQHVNANRVPLEGKRYVAGAVVGEDQNAKPSNETGKRQKFIAFIGNLPYSATKESITEHFSAIAPFSVRLQTDPQTKRSRGFGFLEFEGYDKMKSCLKLYHHSTFGEGKKARKINVELTAGGGGKGENRKAKIKEKNEKLAEERKKAHEEEAKQRKKGGKTNAGTQVDGAAAPEDENTDVHPSRRKRMGL